MTRPRILSDGRPTRGARLQSARRPSYCANLISSRLDRPDGDLASLALTPPRDPVFSPSLPTSMAASTSSAATSGSKPACKHLVLDAGPLLSLSPLRGLSEAYYTVPQVLDELKDKRAREHFERLGLSAGVRIEMKGPTTASIAHGEYAASIKARDAEARSSDPVGKEDGRLCCALASRYLRPGFDI